MAEDGFLKRHGIVRDAIKQDLLQFALPGITVFVAELIFFGRYGDGLSGFWGIVWGLVKHLQNLFVFPVQRIAGLGNFSLA